MFECPRREFGRVCVRIHMNAKLPTGVWVEGDEDRFFQRIEYERLPNLYFECEKIGHLKNDCAKVNMENRVKSLQLVKATSSNMVGKESAEGNQKLAGDGLIEKEEYKPWMLVRYGKKKFKNNWPRRPVSRVDSRSNSVQLKKSEKIDEVTKGDKLIEEQKIVEQNLAGSISYFLEVGNNNGQVVLKPGDNSFSALVDMEEGE
ncbi:hypothetical protein MA16_Dca027427 [Dendrobium catenatum]|uniref:Zinc knuckle CX2CX4HX4C domain-containing protein n=1 Tax=Dendrobium catenatum TaxID=906689 RepID=A0A2I0V6Z8_9ASPA|nr:hypothetical protein MA16_Dca027427 [Dendrobium catenatum]